MLKNAAGQEFLPGGVFQLPTSGWSFAVYSADTIFGGSFLEKNVYNIKDIHWRPP